MSSGMDVSWFVPRSSSVSDTHVPKSVGEGWNGEKRGKRRGGREGEGGEGREGREGESEEADQEEGGREEDKVRRKGEGERG